MRSHTIAFLQGDGIGREQAEFWAKELPGLGERFGFAVTPTILPFGKGCWQDCGNAVPESTLQGMREACATLLAAVDSKGMQGATPVGTLRRELNLFADVRPIRARKGRWAYKDDLDLVCIRESTQGFLADRNLHAGCGEWMSDGESAFSLRVITYEASCKIARFTFEYARKAGRKKITALHKESIFKMTCGLFLRACRDVAREYPDIRLAEDLVDNAANALIADPGSFDILLTTNLFGDILSDEAAALVSSLAPSGNFGDEADLYLPVSHQPAYAALERGDYDPIPFVLCIQMMLERIGEEEAARALDRAVGRVLADGRDAAGVMMRSLIQQI